MIRARGSLKGNITARGSLKGAVNIGIERIYPEVKNLDITPTAETQIFQDDTLNYGIVKVFGDANLQATNIKKGVSIFGVDGTLEELTTEIKEGIDNQEEILNTQENTLNNINQVVQDKILVKEKYRPRYMYSGSQIYFSYYTGTELDHETTMFDPGCLTKMDSMFRSCINLTKLDLSGWNTSNVTAMQNMFRECEKLEDLNISNFNTSNVTNMSYMFYKCKKLTELDVRHFDTSNATHINDMFYDCASLTELDLSNFDTSNAISVGGMFYGCEKLKDLNISSFNTSKVTNMGSMFMYCKSLTELDLSHFDTSKVTNMSQMFWDCTKLTKLDLRSFDFTMVTSYINMFVRVPEDCLIIVKGETEKQWLTSKFTSLTNIKTVAELEV